MSKIILVNGPPMSGKDTLCNYLVDEYNGKLRKFAAPIKRAVAAIYHNNDRSEFNKYDSPELKQEPQGIYFGQTCRRVQIAVSESFLKPFHNDQGIFGKILAERLENDLDAPVFVSDSGFRREAEELVAKFGEHNIVLLRIFRDGYTFEGDSRDYITLRDLGVQEYDVYNPEDNLAAFYGSATYILNTILENNEQQSISQ